MITYDINTEQYNSPVQVEHQTQNNYAALQQKKIMFVAQKMNNLNFNDESCKMLLDTIEKLKIPITLATELLALCSTNIYLIIDDSQSMHAHDTGLFEENSDTQLMRIEELKIRLQSIAPIICSLTKFDIKIKILSTFELTTIIPANLSANEKLKHFNQIIESLEPTAGTPLIQATTIMAKDAEAMFQRTSTKSVLYIFTDGVPNDKHIGSGKEQVEGFIAALNGIKSLKTGVLSIGISACTGDDTSIGWLTKIDQDPSFGSAINTQDDFFSEAQSIYFSHGNMLPFNNYGFYITTGLLAPLIPWIDNINEDINLTKEELSIATNKEITDNLYAEYIISATKARQESKQQYYISWISSAKNNVNFELEIVTINGKKYRNKISSNKISSNKNSNNQNVNSNILTNIWNNVYNRFL